MPTRSINLTEHFEHFIEAQVSAGRFRNASEVMRAGLDLLEQRTREEQEKLDLLRALASEGFGELDQGRGIELDNNRQLANYIGEIGRRAAKGRRRARAD